LSFDQIDPKNNPPQSSNIHILHFDTLALDFGVRTITTSWNATTRSRQAFVNGQPIFIKGGTGSSPMSSFASAPNATTPRSASTAI